MRAHHQLASAPGALPGRAAPLPGRETSPAAVNPDSRTLRLNTPQCALRFHLQRVHGGLYVERETVARRGPSLQQFVLLPDAASSAHWCDSDPVRFDHPLLHTQLRRAADELWHTPATQPLG